MRTITDPRGRSAIMSLADAPLKLRKGLEDLRLASHDDDLVVDILEAARLVVKKRRPTTSALTEDQVAFLIESGAFTKESLARTEAAVEDGALARLEQESAMKTVTESLSAAEVAEALRVDASRVRHRQAKNHLYSFTIGRKRRYPSWQFTGNVVQPVLPHLSTIVKACEGLPPSTVRSFMGAPQQSLKIDDAEVTPAQWLMNGGDPQAVVDIIESFDLS